MTYIAHKTIIDEIEHEQELSEHLIKVAEMAEEFSVEPLKNLAYLAGILHDIGKFSEEFQLRIRGSTIQVEHAVQGAVEVPNFVDKNLAIASALLQYIIIGHHSGLPDGGAEADDDSEPTLHGRLKRKFAACGAFKSEIKPETITDKWLENELFSLVDRSKSNDENKKNIYELAAFFTRYIFSCLTDADFLDTEIFCNPKIDRKISGDFDLALELVNKKLDSFSADTDVKKARSKLLSQAVSGVAKTAQINLLNMPTGSGKTLTSLKLALEIAKQEGKKRIIYVIPYTSITEQTAENFHEILGESAFILEHYSSFDYEKFSKSGGNTTLDKIKRATENWDSPIVITTTVQLFESLYHYKGRKLRKLHNLADSVIVLDEIHLLPVENLQPCIRAIGYITKYLNSKAIFLSATMPNYIEIFEKYIPNNTFKKLIFDEAPYRFFKNQTIKSLGKISLEALAAHIPDDKSTLVVTNKKATARDLYKLVRGKKFHLSTNMTPLDRQAVLSKIKACINREEKLVVVSTSLIEAGVDLDFEVAYREIAGLDNVLQTAGRCNREGKREAGLVYAFEIGDISGEMQARANVTKGLFKRFDDVSCAECTEEYFKEVFGLNFSKIDGNSIYNFDGKIASPKNIPFRKYAEHFKMISDESFGVVINKNGICDTLLQSLEFGGFAVKRELQKHTVNVRFYQFESMLKSGLVSETNGVFVLTDNSLYSDEYGLAIDEHYDESLIFC